MFNEPILLNNIIYSRDNVYKDYKKFTELYKKYEAEFQGSDNKDE